MRRRHSLLRATLLALVVLLALAILWPRVAPRYDALLLVLAGPFRPAEVVLLNWGSHIGFISRRAEYGIAMPGYALHYGMLLLAALVVATPTLGVATRLAWLGGLVVGFTFLHAATVASMAWMLMWVLEGQHSPAVDSGTALWVGFSLWWMLLPALIAGAWCWRTWYPGIRRARLSGQGGAGPGRKSARYLTNAPRRRSLKAAMLDRILG
ncbi:MAG: hypothetical protein HY686_06590 [Chloroflexi bacterium]|nr:hypothetical protein [Chloroflexota bacterium]